MRFLFCSILACFVMPVVFFSRGGLEELLIAGVITVGLIVFGLFGGSRDDRETDSESLDRFGNPPGFKYGSGASGLKELEEKLFWEDKDKRDLEFEEKHGRKPGLFE